MLTASARSSKVDLMAETGDWGAGRTRLLKGTRVGVHDTGKFAAKYGWGLDSV